MLNLWHTFFDITLNQKEFEMRKTSNVRWSESLYRKASLLLASCGLREILRKHGEVHPLGSYSAKLMMNADIDFHVVLPGKCTRRQVLRVQNEILMTGRFEHCMTWDNRNFDRPGRITAGVPRGYYIGLKN